MGELWGGTLTKTQANPTGESEPINRLKGRAESDAP